MPKVLFAGCLHLSQAVPAQFTLEMCVAAQNHEKNLKNVFLGFKVVDLDVDQ